jgi:hypothetical protein
MMATAAAICDDRYQTCDASFLQGCRECAELFGERKQIARDGGRADGSTECHSCMVL